MTILTSCWTERFVGAWNGSSPACDAMQNAGIVCFVERSVDCDAQRAFFWDAYGRVSIVNRIDGAMAPAFIASSPVWSAFLGGRIEARRAVLTRQILFIGSIRFALAYGDAFNWVPRVAAPALFDPCIGADHER